MRRQLQQDLLRSDLIHRPLEIHHEETREARCAGKQPAEAYLLDDLKTLDRFRTVGELARMELSREHTHGCENSLKFTCPTKLDHWPGAYGRIYSIPKVVRVVDDENWE